MTLSTIVFTCLLGYILTGCGGSPTPRLMDIVGIDVFPHKGLPLENDEWRNVPKIGLVLHSDATAQNAAPAIISEYLDTLTRRTAEFLRQRCTFHEIMTLSPFSKPDTLSQELKVQGQRFQVPYEIVVVFSSREKAGPEKIGEATMMTQMGGTVIENSTRVEVGVLRVSDFKMVFWTSGRGTESLEQLDAPIGKNRPSATQARDIMRARAGQYALDRALNQLGLACRSGR